MSKFVHSELSTTDPAAAKKFYKAIFGWKYQEVPMPGGTYTMVLTSDGQGVGGIAETMGGAPPAWTGYATVASVKRTLKKIEGRGGKVIQPYTEVPGMGHFAIVTDPQGAVFAIWEELAKPAAKKASKKKAAKKKAAPKKAAPKKAAKKKAAKKAAKAAPKKAAKKKAAKKAAPKKAAKKAAPKKAAKKKAAKKKAADKK